MANSNLTKSSYNGQYMTKYDPNVHPKLLIEAGKMGFLRYAQCSYLNISDVTFYKWVKLYPDFEYAAELAETACKGFYEMQAAMMSKKSEKLLMFMLQAHNKMITQSDSNKFISSKEKSKDMKEIAKLLMFGDERINDNEKEIEHVTDAIISDENN
jgi:hypothetical protein